TYPGSAPATLVFIGRAVEAQNRFPLLLTALVNSGRAAEAENRYALFLATLVNNGRAAEAENRYALFLATLVNSGRAAEAENRYALFLATLWAPKKRLHSIKSGAKEIWVNPNFSFSALRLREEIQPARYLLSSAKL
ncbi:hypothetical protein MNBD_ALPHA11-238, partial [hydrothermal vent metagenome]